LAKQKQFLGVLALVCACAWVASAIRPVDQQAWLLENILLVLFVACLAIFYSRLQLSNASYFFLALFIVLHLIGAHYTYAKVPIGFWAQEHFGFSRNHYDRFGHAAFGFLLVFPVRELLLRFSGIKRGWSYCLAIGVIVAVSGVFEIIESITAEMVAPGQGVNWLAGQGDEWDAQNDMLSAAVGSVLMMGVVVVRQRFTRR
jgi:putative membrane protein